MQSSLALPTNISRLLALIWVCLRMSKRWYLSILVIATALGFLILNMMPTPGVAALPAMMLVLSVGGITTLSAITIGSSKGFPFFYQYRQPVSTTALVLTPMLTMGLLCASVYFIPVALFSLFYNLSFPFFSVSILIFFAAIIQLGASWSSTNDTVRTVALISAMFIIALVLRWIDPMPDDFRNIPFGPEVIAMTLFEYIVIAAIMLGVFTMTLTMVRLQRSGGLGASSKALNSSALDTTQEVIGDRRSSGKHIVLGLGLLVSRLAAYLPIDTALKAEIWVELRRYGILLVLQGALASLFIPLVLLLSQRLNIFFLFQLSYAAPVGIYFTGLGLAVFNRRTSSSGFMMPFEASRAMSTFQLSMVQMGTLGVSVLLGAGLTLVSLALSEYFLLSHIAEPLLITKFQALAGDRSWLYLLSVSVVVLVFHFSAVIFFSCLNFYSCLWGKKFIIGVTLSVIYLARFTANVLGGIIELQEIIFNMWLFTSIVAFVTATLFYKVISLKLLELNKSVPIIGAWLIFTVLAYYYMLGRGDDLLMMRDESLAFSLSMLVLPITFLLMTVYSYDRLRHAR